MIKLLYGKEPYLLDVEKRRLLAQGAELFHEFNQEVAGRVSCTSLFTESVAIVVDVPNLNALDNRVFRQMVSAPLEESDLLILVREFDGRTKLSKELIKNKNIEMQCCNKVTDAVLTSFVVNTVCKRFSVRIREDALEEALFCIGYQEETSVNLYDVARIFENLCDASDGEIDLALVRKLLKRRGLDKRFQIARYIKEGNMPLLVEQAEALKSENPIGILMLLAKEMRVAYKATYFSLREIGARDCCFKDFSRKQLVRMQEIPLGIVRDIKNGGIPSEMALMLCFDRLCQEVASGKERD